jgi:hypothetical protein
MHQGHLLDEAPAGGMSADRAGPARFHRAGQRNLHRGRAQNMTLMIRVVLAAEDKAVTDMHKNDIQ